MSALFERLFGLTLLDPGFLLLALVVLLGAWWARRRGGPAVLFSPAYLTRGIRPSFRVSLVPLPRILAALGLLFMIVALARPALRTAEAVSSVGVDILLCIDTSSSMRSDDLERGRTRLEIARTEAVRFIEARPHDRIGLITFARYPDVRCPLTLDHVALVDILESVVTVTGDGAEDATGIGTAVARAAHVLDAANARSRAVVLLTDGAENVALAGKDDEIPPQHAAQLCERLGVRVYPVVVGAARVGPDGKAVDTTAVEAMATRTGGAFQRARDAEAVAAVYARVDELEKAKLESPRYVFADRYVGFLGVGLVLLLIAVLLGTSVLAVLP